MFRRHHYRPLSYRYHCCIGHGLVAIIILVHDGGTFAIHDRGAFAIHDSGAFAVHDSGAFAVHDSSAFAIHDSGAFAVHNGGLIEVVRQIAVSAHYRRFFEIVCHYYLSSLISCFELCPRMTHVPPI